MRKKKIIISVVAVLVISLGAWFSNRIYQGLFGTQVVVETYQGRIYYPSKYILSENILTGRTDGLQHIKEIGSNNYYRVEGYPEKDMIYFTSKKTDMVFISQI